MVCDFFPLDSFRIFCLLSAILHLGNIRYKRKTYRDDSIDICNPEVLPVVSELLEVRTQPTGREVPLTLRGSLWLISSQRSLTRSERRCCLKR